MEGLVWTCQYLPNTNFSADNKTRRPEHCLHKGLPAHRKHPTAISLLEIL